MNILYLIIFRRCKKVGRRRRKSLWLAGLAGLIAHRNQFFPGTRIFPLVFVLHTFDIGAVRSVKLFAFRIDIYHRRSLWRRSFCRFLRCRGDLCLRFGDRSCRRNMRRIFFFGCSGVSLRRRGRIGRLGALGFCRSGGSDDGAFPFGNVCLGYGRLRRLSGFCAFRFPLFSCWQKAFPCDLPAGVKESF